VDSRIFIVLVLESEFIPPSLIFKILAFQIIDNVTQLSEYHLRCPASHGRSFCVASIDPIVTIGILVSCISTCYVFYSGERSLFPVSIENNIDPHRDSVGT
jgi:hypothetical protein